MLSTILLIAENNVAGQTRIPEREAAIQDRAKKIRQVTGEIVPNQYIVVLKDNNLRSSDIRSLANEARFDGATVRHTYEHALKGFAIRIPNQLVLDRILSNPRVDYVEPDTKQKLSVQILPTGVDRADGDLSVAKSGDGAGTINVDVAILDTGVDLNHPDLNVVNHVDCISSGQCVTGPVAGDDDNGHGTKVAGIVAAKDDAQGVVGFAPGARLWAVKVFDSNGQGFDSDLIAGIDYVTQHASEIDVVNYSGGGGHSSSEHTAYINSVGAGLTHVVAAGNDRVDAATQDPASYPEVITVSAFGDFDGKCGALSTSWATDLQGRTTHDDNFASFSNFGSVIDLGAPGISVLTTAIGGSTATFSGTSAASPHVAGAAALYKSIFPAASPADVRSSLMSSGSVSSTVCDGKGHGYLQPFTGDPGDPDSIREPLLYVAKTDASLPTVTSATPASGATNVPVTSVITATFSEVVQGSTVNPSTFLLKNSGGTTIAGAVTLSGDGRTGIFTPSSPLAPSTSFTATVSPNSANSVKDLAGNAMAAPYAWSFTTGSDGTPPTVASTDPTASATNVPVTKWLRATFSEPMLGSSITTSTFTLKASGSSTNVPGVVWLNTESTSLNAYFAPSSNLSPGTTYTATVTTGVKDLAGNTMLQAKTWSFTTATSSDTTPPTVASTDPTR